MNSYLCSKITKSDGIVVILAVILIFFFFGVAALGLDVTHMLVLRNELQNSADAGCLAGGRFLYSEDGSTVNEESNNVAYHAVMANSSEKNPIEIRWSGGNTGDIERGHWSFSTRSFTPSDSNCAVNLSEVSMEELDSNPDFVNAIRVVVRREIPPLTPFFTALFGRNGLSVWKEAIAYVGFAGTLPPGESNQPIAICKKAITNNGRYSCSTGRMISFVDATPGEQTGAWTDFSSINPCHTGINPQAVSSLVCGDGNRDQITAKQFITTHSGDIPSAFQMLKSCWESVTGRRTLWKLTLPVVECSDFAIDSCAPVLGAVTINVVWITGIDEDTSCSDAPWVMENPLSGMRWSSNNPDGCLRWDSFARTFNLRKMNGELAPYTKKAIFFLPDCSFHRPIGRTGGENFGILARIPVLVR